MTTRSEKNTGDPAEVKFNAKEQQVREGAKAMAEYRALGAAEREKTARLKLLREQKAAIEAAAAKDKKAAARKPALVKAAIVKPTVVSEKQEAPAKKAPRKRALATERAK